MAAHVQRVEDHGGDRITVWGTVDGYDGEDGQPVVIQASGWVSAMDHHYDAAAYDKGGNLKKNAAPRAMDDAERLAYWEGLLTSSVPQVTEPTVLYEGS